MLPFFFALPFCCSQLSSILSNIFCNNVASQRTPPNEMNCEKCASASWPQLLFGWGFSYFLVVELGRFRTQLHKRSVHTVCNFRQMASHKRDLLAPVQNHVKCQIAKRQGKWRVCFVVALSCHSPYLLF